MSIKFVDDGYNVDDFVDNYIEEYRKVRDSNRFPIEFPIIDGTLSSIFVMADAYNPDDNRSDYELSGDELRESVRALLINNGIITGSFDLEKLHKDTKFTILFYKNGIINNPRYSSDKIGSLEVFPIDPESDYCSILKKLKL